MAISAAEKGDLVRRLMRSTEFTRDALPYTQEFDRLHAEYERDSGTSIDQHDFWRLLSNAAKRGGWKGKRRGEPAPDLTHQQYDALRSHFAGKLGSRDCFPYTAEFDRRVAAFNAETGLSLTHRQLWRALCNAGKESHRPDVEALLRQGLDSLVLAIEHFNRPSEIGRQASVLIMLDHACEMILKAGLLQRDTDIRNPKNGYAHSLEFCANKATDDGPIKFLSNDQRRTLMVLNGLRDQAQHYLVDVSEQILYTVAQGTVTLFSDLLRRLFGRTLAEHLPARVLPISTNPPRDIQVLMDDEFTQLKRLLECGQDDRLKAEPRLRSLLAIDRALKGQQTPVPDEEYRSIEQLVRTSADWTTVFQGVSQLRLATDGVGINIAIHLTKSEGIPVRVAKDGECPEGTVAIRKVDETSFYCYNAKELARRLKLSIPRVVALIRYLGIANAPDCFKEITIGKSRFKMYSANALKRLKDALPTVDMQEVWQKCGPKRKKEK